MKANKKMVIDMNALQLNCRKFTTSEISRGCGVERSKKGRGSYNRKAKHKGIDSYCKTA